MNKSLKIGLLYGGVFAVIGVAGVVALKIAKNKKDLNDAKKKIGEDGNTLFLKEGGTIANPVQARTSPDFKDSKLVGNVIHEFGRAEKGAEIGVLIETVKDSNYKKWHKYIPTKPYTWMKIPYVIAYIEADKTDIK